LGLAACSGEIVPFTITGKVSTSVTVSLGSGQAAPSQAAHAYALAELGTDAQIQAPSTVLGSNNFLAPKYNVFLSNGYYVEGVSSGPGVNTGIDVRTSGDVLDVGANQLGVTTGQQVNTGIFVAAPAATSFTVHALGAALTLYSVSMYGEIGVYSTRLGDAASVSLLVDPVIAIDPAFLAAHPEMQLSVEVGPGVGNVAAVPEPESWAMLIAGLGLLGAMVRRRQS
jgi:hypothetical protein